MPVDLSSGGVVASLRDTVAALAAERDQLQAQVNDEADLYDELLKRDDEVERLDDDIKGLRQWVYRLEAINARQQQALTEIVAKKGRGGLRIAEEALAS